MDARAAAVVARHSLPLPQEAHLEVRAVRGGLQSAVARVLVRTPGATRTTVPRWVVVKELLGSGRREADVYRLLWEGMAKPPIARVLGRTETEQASYLCLEHIRRIRAWPWSDPAEAGALAHALARVHSARDLAAHLPAWDHEEELRASAEETLRAAMSRKADAALFWRCPGELRRVVASLPHMRERLLSAGSTIIHGDMHPGNVLVRAGTESRRVVLIDWAAARVGSPLEDIASWLHSLGCWDLELRRRHDSLLCAHLRATRPGARLDGCNRVNYWVASACNGLRGAICYHLAVLRDPLIGWQARAASRRALDEWQRVIRGAAAVLGRSG